jgi:hypothetical protein
MNSLGQPNYCVDGGGGELSCLPGCTVAADCASFTNTTCTLVSGTESVCRTGTTPGGEAGTGSVGDPCTTSGEACSTDGTGTCNGTWCSAPCSQANGDSACPTNSLGATNYCVENGQNDYICFPGCTSNSDCTPFSGTSCQPVDDGVITGSICAATNGQVGDPCKVDGDCTTAGATCGPDGWCDTSCTSTTDTSCGMTTAGVTDKCIKNGANKFTCFPGCTSANDCVVYSSAFCQANLQGGSGFVCAGSAGGTGDPCNTSGDCTASTATCPGAWCSVSCSSSSDTSCGKNAAGQQNYCVQDSTTLDYDCFPGCKTDADCTPFADTTCISTGVGTQSVCSF